MRSQITKSAFKVILWVMSVLMGTLALADTEVFSFQMVEVPKPEPVYMPNYNVMEQYELDDEEVGILSKLLWSSPLTNETYKAQLCWVVFNRLLDPSGMFEDTVKEVVNKREFAFYDAKAHRSETNDRIARTELNLYYNVLHGKSVERVLPRGYIYIRFTGDRNQTLLCSKEIGGDPYVG